MRSGRYHTRPRVRENGTSECAPGTSGSYARYSSLFEHDKFEDRRRYFEGSERRLEAIEHEFRTIAMLEPDAPSRTQALDTAEAISTLILVFDIDTDEDTEPESIIHEIDRRVTTLSGEVNELAAIWNGD